MISKIFKFFSFSKLSIRRIIQSQKQVILTLGKDPVNKKGEIQSSIVNALDCHSHLFLTKSV